MFSVVPDADYPDAYTAIVCGFMNNNMKESFSAVWDLIDIAQNHLGAANREMSEKSGELGKQ